MKKILYVVAIAIAATTFACSNKTAADQGADLKAKIENCTNPDSLQLYVEQAREYAQKLIAEGKDSEAQAYLAEVIPAVTAKDPSLGDKLTAEADSVISALKDKAGVVTDSVASKATSAVDSVASKTGKAVEATKDAVNKGADAVNKGADAVKGAADKVKNLVK